MTAAADLDQSKQATLHKHSERQQPNGRRLKEQYKPKAIWSQRSTYWGPLPAPVWYLVCLKENMVTQQPYN